jgi:hypothetical protein
VAWGRCDFLIVLTTTRPLMLPLLTASLIALSAAFLVCFAFALRLRRRRLAPVPLLSISELHRAFLSFVGDPCAAKVIAQLQEFHTSYTAGFLARPHADLGRAGVVCPFIPVSIKKDCVYYGAVTAVELQEAAATVLQCADVQFPALLPPHNTPDAVYKTVILVFTGFGSDTAAAQFVDDLQRHLKPAFVERGLMIGAFHPGSRFPGLHNPSFYPRAAPFASVDIRLMIPEDLKFLRPAAVTSRHTTGEARGMLSAYVARFEPLQRVLPLAHSYLRELTKS